MKRAFHLFEKIVSFENLFLASRKARKGKRSRAPVLEFEMELEPELLLLERELSEGTYRPGPYESFHVRDPKPRHISAAPYRDRVVHHALMSVIEPIFDRGFIDDSFACRLGRGTHRAADRFQGYLRKHRYVLKADVSKYFASIDHAILKDRIRRRIGCRRTLDLVDLIIESSNPQEDVYFLFPGDDLFTPLQRRRGIPLGNLTSQFFANVYLDPLDHFVKERLRVPGYVRYVDDLALFGDSKDNLRRWLAELGRAMESSRLKLHPKKTRIYRADEGIEFLGYRIWPDRRRLTSANVKRAKARIRSLRRAYAQGCPSPAVWASLRAWIAHAEHAQTWRLREALLEDAVFQRTSS